ncbi:SAM-dependent methyltransferase [Angulomicrobium tetraedrale]|uniref:SAM-dependent methyltransferase n=1 Tax=Ancylobacter tetraedralis TaxID=217068 RepID=A0A839Z907_9HYPH|nr:methyltransferase domain-containing protein [Ancylobacter tetraedralis]MBB3771038.1 SAM-dependent methyltransferase [Ancylobacter tetraedralis]
METKQVKYTERFFQDLADDSYRSAFKILGIVFDITRPESVIDFGCGTGSWLKAAHELGASRVAGVDGPWVTKGQLVDGSIALITSDMSLASTPAVSAGAFDLAISLECGEHLPASRADWLVDNMCDASSKVLFGSAIPGQGGTDHINEQWPSYWAEKFRARGYLPLDLVRPNVCFDQSIPTWYRNNPLMYIHEDEHAQVRNTALSSKTHSLTITDFVIPQLFDDPGLRQSMRIASHIPGKLARSLLWRWKIRRWSM